MDTKSKLYCGNKKPFLYAVFHAEDRAEAVGVLAGLQQKGHAVWYAPAFSAAEKKRLDKAAAVAIFVSPAAVGDENFRQAVAGATQADKPLIVIRLAETELSAGLSMQLGACQNLLKYEAANGTEFMNKLCDAPVLAGLSVTPQQQKAARRTVAGLCGAGVAAAAIAILIAGFALLFSPISSDSELARLGLSGNALSVTDLYVYSGRVLDYYTLADSRYSSDGDLILLYNTQTTLPREDGVTDLTDFSQLTNLEQLSLCGNAITDLTPLYALKQLRLLDVSVTDVDDLTGIEAMTALETLNVSNTSVADLTPLLGCPALKTVYLSCLMSDLASALEGSGIEIRYIETSVSTFEELKAASVSGDALSIWIAADIEIPADETVTIRSGVVLQGLDITLTVNGTLALAGTQEMGMAERVITESGTLHVLDGGYYCGGMGSTQSRGRLIVDAGGMVSEERGENMTLEDGSVTVNNGTIRMRDGGKIHWLGGSFENNGTVELINNPYDNVLFEGDPAEMTGTGQYIESYQED